MIDTRRVGCVSRGLLFRIKGVLINDTNKLNLINKLLITQNKLY